MTGIPELVPPETRLCWFGIRSLPPLLEAFEKEIEGVKASEDIEYIHRMRVASRRLRAALPLFRRCFPQKQYARWMHEIAGITRALGVARDMDVQIAFLLRFRKKRSASVGVRNHAGPGTANPMELAIAYLLKELRRKRRELQVRVLSSIEALQKSGVIDEMRTTCFSQIAAGRLTPVQSIAYGVPTVAAHRIGSRLEAMRSYEPWVTHPDAVAEHHAMRIAAKKLRYTMEVYGPVYRLGLKKPYARVKKVQEILGDLHDCDVWIDHVTRLLLRERSRMRSEKKENRPDTATLASMRIFLHNRERERILVHRHFVRYWQTLTRIKIWNDLRQTLTNGRRKRFVPAREFREPEVRMACEAFAAAYPDWLAHHRTVTRLALMLFDSLQSLHRMSRHDRALLESAALLHDIGWVGGQKRHNARTARMIFAEESLPLDISDRIMVGLVAGAHRGQVRTGSHPLFALLGPEHQKRVLQLAAILRVADGLDFLHTASVQEIHCIIGTGEITCDVISAVDVMPEKERARSKSGLFVSMFERELVIR